MTDIIFRKIYTNYRDEATKWNNGINTYIKELKSLDTDFDYGRNFGKSLNSVPELKIMSTNDFKIRKLDEDAQ
jgi:hypothetical protein